MENTEYVVHFKNLLSPIFPSSLNPEIILVGPYQETIQVSWPMPEPKLPSKRSRPIHVIFSSEVLSDYANLGPLSRKNFDARLVDYIQNQYKNFDPTHEQSSIIDPSPTPKRWVVPLALFG